MFTVVRKALLLRILSAAYMQRWNDKIRPVELTELDKQSHKMIVAFFLGKFEEAKPEFDWIEIIEGGLFELLQRVVLTDLKPPVFYRMKEDKDKYARLNKWVYGQLESTLSPLGADFCKRFQQYFASDEDTLNRRILQAAHFYATKWEFDILDRANPNGYEIPAIRQRLQQRQEKFYDLSGIDSLAKYEKHRNFIDLCGQLRFQSRWANVHRVPKTSVMGHMLFVAILAYLFSLEIQACKVRRVNNYLTGLFHDLPEVLTRDIISPVKGAVEGLSELIKEYENEEMEREVYGLLPAEWRDQVRLFTEEEFTDVATIDGHIQQVASEDLHSKYNYDKHSPRDGSLVKAVDELAAFVEAYSGLRNGSASPELREATVRLREKYDRKTICTINFGELYADFD